MSDPEWAEFKRIKTEKSIQKRANNRRKSTQLLRNAGVNFTEHNNGAHLVVTSNQQIIDFWPGTGKWGDRKRRHYRRGVHSLLEYLKTCSSNTYQDNNGNQIPLPEEEY